MLWFAVSAVNKNAPMPNATNPNRGRVPTARIKDQYKDLAQPSPLNSILLLLMRSPVNSGLVYEVGECSLPLIPSLISKNISNFPVCFMCHLSLLEGQAPARDMLNHEIGDLVPIRVMPASLPLVPGPNRFLASSAAFQRNPCCPPLPMY